ncbi:hypothetical protein BH708_02440 [Brachybacterium sp. P6-10-X1]|nr:hypothetical protein BH708_02440 [Brachybacterium sp. P6-10-X1]
MAAGPSTRIAKVALGWVLVVFGLTALVLPGPGLLALFAGMVLLSQQYQWARRRVQPLKRAAFKSAANSVQTTPRILASLLGISALIGAGIVWGVRPAAPNWWPLPQGWWLLGGWGTGATLIFSGLVALAILVYSYRRFRNASDPEAEATGADDDQCT